MHVIAHPYSRVTHGSSNSTIGATPARTSAPSSISAVAVASTAAAAAAAAASIFLSTPSVASTPYSAAAAASPTDQIFQRNKK